MAELMTAILDGKRICILDIVNQNGQYKEELRSFYRGATFDIRKCYTNAYGETKYYTETFATCELKMDEAEVERVLSIINKRRNVWEWLN